MPESTEKIEAVEVEGAPVKRRIKSTTNNYEPTLYSEGEWIDRLRQIMEEYNINQATMAKRLGTSTIQIHRWIRGRHKPMPTWWEKIQATFPKIEPIDPLTNAGRSDGRDPTQLPKF